MRSASEGDQGGDQRDPRLRRVRRWRTHRLTCRRPCACSPAPYRDRATGAGLERPGCRAKLTLSRAVGAAQPAQRPRRRHDAAGPPAVRAWRPMRSTASAELDRRLDGRQRDQRQDDDGGDDRRHPRAAGGTPVHNRAGSNMTWGVATALLEQRGEEGLFEVDEAWLPRVVGQLEPRLIVLGNLFRDQLDRYGELETLADRWAELVGLSWRAEPVRRRRRSADRRPRRDASFGRDPASPTSGSTTQLRRSPSSSTPTTPSTAAAAGSPTPTSGPSSATSVTTRARLRRRAARGPTSPPSGSSCYGMTARARSSPRPWETSSRAAPPRPLQRLQRPGRRGGGSALGRPPPASPGEGLEMRASSAVSRRSRSGQTGLDPPDQESGRRNEVLRTLTLEGHRWRIDLGSR